MTKNVRILLADDHELLRHGLRRLLESQAGWKICGEAATGREAVEKCRQLKPDIVILDHTMPELSGAEAARQILKELPQTKIVILTMHDSELLLREVLEAGVHGYVLKSDAMGEMVVAVHALLEDKRYLSPGASGVAVEGFLHGTADVEPADRLTSREREIVRLLAEGKSNKEVASALNISVKTVEAHRANVMHKLNLPSFAELVRYAIRTRIVES